MEYCLALRKEMSCKFATLGMEQEGVMNKVNQKNVDRYRMSSLICQTHAHTEA